MKIAIATDHAGFPLKQHIISYLQSQNIEHIDYGCHTAEPVDYPDHAIPAVESVTSGECKYAILICGTGLGMSIIANKTKGIRASLCHNAQFAQLTREHNDANVLVLAGKFTEFKTAEEIIQTFCHTEFSMHERHIKRINKIKQYENK